MTPTRADVCAAAIADAFADDGELFASPMGLLPMLGVRLCRLTQNPDLVISDGEAMFLASPPPLSAKGDVVEGWIPFRRVFDVVAYGNLAAMHRDAFITDEAIDTTVHLDAHRADSDLDDLDLDPAA